MIELPRHLDLDNPEFSRAYELLCNTNANVFLTGKAGTGKSTFLRYVCSKLRKKYVVLAPTGVAAVNVGGVTIHSFFQMPLRPVPPDDPEYSVASLKKSRKLSPRKKKLIQELELIIIDEVSMVRPDMIDFIDRTLRAVTGRRRKPFGGIQLLLVGDIFQLEPVVTSDTRAILSKYYPDFFFFNALAYSSANLVSVELKKIYRQTDESFIGMLDRIRMNMATDEDFQILNRKVDRDALDKQNNGPGWHKFGITLAARRDAAAMINKEKMDELPSDELVFEGEIKDDFPDKLLPTDLSLVLKKDAQVMLIRNDKEKRWVNGTLARIVEISQKEIKVELEDGKIETVERETWENINYVYDEKEKKVKEEVLGTFTQYPLKAAWALTIHKSQGLTFNNVAIDMGWGAFSAGQTYVALSRCRSLEGLTLLNPVRKGDVIVSKGAKIFSRTFNDDVVASRVLREAKASEISREAISDFNAGRYWQVVDSLWDAHLLTGFLARSGVRRLIARMLGKISSLEKEVRQQKKQLKTLAEEFVAMGDICRIESGDDEAALNNYKKAFSIDADNNEAHFKMALCCHSLGNDKESAKILEKFLKTKRGFRYEALLLKGDICADKGESSRAVLNYLAASKLRPNERRPLELVVEVYSKAGLDDLADSYREMLDEMGNDKIE